MNVFVLLTTDVCHLCSHGRDVLDRLASEGLLSWREVNENSAEGRVLAAAAPPLRPVLYGPAGRITAYGRLSEKRLRHKLALPA